MILSPSILSADFAALGRDIGIVEAAGAAWLHVDVMDGVFVPQITIGQPVVKSIRKATGLFLDVHLMIVHPEKHIESFAEAGADLITIHYEAAEDPAAVIRQIHKAGCRAGISIKPGTPVSVLEPFIKKEPAPASIGGTAEAKALTGNVEKANVPKDYFASPIVPESPHADLILMMSVEPGFGGQKYIEATDGKLQELSRMLGADSPLVEVDGGVNKENAGKLLALGVDVLVAGSAVFKGGEEEIINNISYFNSL